MKFKIRLFLMSLMIVPMLQSRYISVKNDTEFFEEINKFEFALVCFLENSDAHHDDKDYRKDVRLLQKTIDATSDTAPYKKLLKHDLGFLVVDARKESVMPLIEKYKISIQDMPQFLLFKNGKVVSSVSGDFAKVNGFVPKADLLDFIDDYFGKELDGILEKKAQDEKEDKEMQLARYAALSNSYRYPYGAYAPYNANGPYSWYGYSTFYPSRGYWGNAFYVP